MNAATEYDGIPFPVRHRVAPVSSRDVICDNIYDESRNGSFEAVSFDRLLRGEVFDGDGKIRAETV